MIDTKETIASFHISMLCNSILNYFDAVKKLKDSECNPFDNKDFNPITTAVFSAILIQTVSVITEFENQFNSDDINIKERIRFVKIILKPAIKRIKKWKDLEKFRNTFLAHSFRDKHSASVILDGSMKSFNIPHSFNDFLILTECIRLITSKIHLFYDDYIGDFQTVVKQHLTTNFENITTDEEATKEIEKITNEVQIQMEKVLAEVNQGTF